jgi:hypothetical protein
MSERYEWRTVYGNKRTLFADKVSVGDFYPVEADKGRVYRVRLFREDTLEAGRARLVLDVDGDEETAKSVLVQMLKRASGESGE